MEKRRTKRKGAVVVSIVARDPGASANVVAGFTAGVRNAVPRAEILTGYSHSFSDPSVCEAIANRQIDKGSRVVYAASGTCSLGALSATAVRGVWGIGADVDRSYLGPHVLVSAVKRLDRATDYAIRSFLGGTLEQGTLDIGIERDAVGIVGISPEVPPDIRRKLVRVAEQHRKQWASYSSPLSG